MTDFRNYIYRLAEGVSGEEMPRVESWVGLNAVIVGSTVEDEAWRGQIGEPTKTPAGWRYDA